MTTFNTGNPIGSTDARDRSDNSENLDFAVNSLEQTFVDRLGVTRDTLEGVYQKSAYYRAGTFDAGYTLTNNRQTLAYGQIEYSWAGAFPKVVPSGATPLTSGGVGAGAWVDRTQDTLRTEFGYRCVVFSYLLNAYPDHNDAFEYALSTGRTIIIDRDMTLTRDIVKSENTWVDIICVNDAKVIGIDYAPRLRSNPEHRISGTAKRSFFPYMAGDTRHETMFSQDGVVSGRNSEVRQNMVTAYFGADSMDSTYPHIWAVNTVTNVHKDASTSPVTGATAEHYGYELDVNVDADNTGSGAVVEGLRVAGVGDFSNWPLAYAIHVMRDNSGLYKWPVGLFLEECKIGVYVLNPTVYAALFRGNKPMSFIPNSQESNEIINVRNPADTQSLFYVDDVGRTRVASLSVGGGSAATKQLFVSAPNIGFGDIPAGSFAAKSFTELFGTLSVNYTTSICKVMALKEGGLPAGIFVDTYYNTTTGLMYARVSNTTASTFANTAISINVEITQY